MKKKKLPKFSPEVIKDDHGKVKNVVLKYSVYEAILDQMAYFKQSIAQSKKKIEANKKLKK